MIRDSWFSPTPWRSLCCLLLASSTITASHAADWEGAHVQQTLLDASVRPENVMVAFASSATRNGCRVAKVEGNALDGYAVRVDGVAGPRYSQIATATPLFSEDGSSVAYAARRGITWRWVVNGAEEPAFSEMTPTSFAFSADGRHYAYIATPSFRRTVLMVDGAARPPPADAGVLPWDAAPLFSEDGKWLAWVESSRESQMMRVSISGKTGGWHSDIAMADSPGFGAQAAAGPDSGPAASRPQPGVFGMTFSRDGKHFAYTAAAGKGWCKIVDGVASPAYEGIGFDFIFSPDGSDHAYMVHDGARRFIVRGQGRPISVEDVNNWTLTFSPDGRHLAFAGIRDGVNAVWIDGRAAPSDIPVAKTKNQGSLFFSPDSQRLAFQIEATGSRLHWVVDGKAGPATTLVLGQFDFSADSAHFAYVLPRPESKDVAIVVDGKVRAAYQTILSGPVFRQDGTLEFLAMKDGALSRFKVTGY